eukprot:scaffold2799_cov159-Ochromonas_danica.AAC.15
MEKVGERKQSMFTKIHLNITFSSSSRKYCHARGLTYSVCVCGGRVEAVPGSAAAPQRATAHLHCQLRPQQPVLPHNSINNDIIFVTELDLKKMSFPAFKDLEKPITDLLNDDYDHKYSLKIKSAGPANTTVTTVTQFDKDFKLTPKLNLKWVHASGFTLDKVEVAADGKVALEASLTNAAPGLKLDFKGKDADKADVSLTYTIPAATITADVDVGGFSSVKAAFTAGKGPVTAGASADLKIVKGAVDSPAFNVGLAYTVPNKLLVVAKADNNFAKYTASLNYAAVKDVTVVGQVTYDGKQPAATVGASYTCNPNTTVKVKATTAGVFSASVKQALDKKFNVVGSAELSNNLANYKLGVNATLG